MNDTKQSTEDLAILEQLNLDYNNADQASDAKRFSEFLAEAFVVQTPGAPAIATSTSNTSLNHTLQGSRSARIQDPYPRRRCADPWPCKIHPGGEWRGAGNSVHRRVSEA